MATSSCCKARNSDSKSSANSAYFGKALSSNTPKGGGGFALSSAQTSGVVRRDRHPGKIENLKGMPSVHTGGSNTYTVPKPKATKITV
jgi:hypothetical protein